MTGVARVVLDPVGARLEPGEILVAPSTDPGWTPLFLTAGGLVMEMGGANSHGAVVAREYGIPAVVGVAGATEQIATGDAGHGRRRRGLVVPAVPSPAIGDPAMTTAPRRGRCPMGDGTPATQCSTPPVWRSPNRFRWRVFRQIAAEAGVDPG